MNILSAVGWIKSRSAKKWRSINIFTKGWQHRKDFMHIDSALFILCKTSITFHWPPQEALPQWLILRSQFRILGSKHFCKKFHHLQSFFIVIALQKQVKEQTLYTGRNSNIRHKNELDKEREGWETRRNHWEHTGAERIVAAHLDYRTKLNGTMERVNF